MTGPGYEVTPATLTEAARGMEDVLGELRSLGLGVGRAEAGRGVWALAAGTGPAGHAGLGEAFATFCSRWEWGVRALVRAGREMTDGLGAAAAAYEIVDSDQSGLIRRLVVDGPAPDQSWDETRRSMAETWTEVGQDIAANSVPGVVARAMQGANPVQGLLDDLAGLHEIVE